MRYKGSLIIALAVLVSLPLVWAQTTPEPAKPDAQAEARPVSTPPAPSEPLTPEKRGDIFMARKMFREAIEQYKTCEQTPVVLNKTGIAYHQQLSLGTAKKYYRNAIKANPKYAEAVNNLGTVYYAEKSYRKAVGQYKKALELTPESASVYSNLGTAYFARKEYKLAADAYQKAISLDPDVFERHSSYGVLLQDSQVAERARFHYYLAKTFAQNGRTDRALIYIRKALEEGFKEKKKFLEEPEFAALQELAEFKELMAVEPRVL